MNQINAKDQLDCPGSLLSNDHGSRGLPYVLEFRILKIQDHRCGDASRSHIPLHPHPQLGIGPCKDPAGEFPPAAASSTAPSSSAITTTPRNATNGWKHAVRTAIFPIQPKPTTTLHHQPSTESASADSSDAAATNGSNPATTTVHGGRNQLRTSWTIFHD